MIIRLTSSSCMSDDDSEQSSLDIEIQKPRPYRKPAPQVRTEEEARAMLKGAHLRWVSIIDYKARDMEKYPRLSYDEWLVVEGPEDAEINADWIRDEKILALYMARFEEE